MLSKRAARTFFLVGTVLSGGTFVMLTVDTFQRIPDQTRRNELSESAIRGKHLWDKNNCMGCHTLFGEGAYYAPELTKVYKRRGPEFIKAMLRDPASMYPGQRKMQQYDLSEQDIEDFVQFFEWVGQVDLNGFPKDPPLAAKKAQTTSRNDAATANVVVSDSPVEGTAPVAAVTGETVSVAPPPVFDQMCRACHQIDGLGGAIGPALDGVGSRLDADYLARWLTDPQVVRPGTTMPKLPLTVVQIDELVTFLAANQ